MIVLVVDDNPDICDLLSEILADALGCTVRTAADGHEALVSLHTCRPLPDAVVLDWMMPELTGGDVLAAMRADAALAQIPVMFCSAAEAALPEGVPIVRKPVDPVELLAVIRSLSERGGRDSAVLATTAPFVRSNVREPSVV